MKAHFFQAHAIQAQLRRLHSTGDFAAGAAETRRLVEEAQRLFKVRSELARGIGIMRRALIRAADPVEKD
ncbi:hypothetical protein BI364_12500 [Acidihalobacter yilgarnensis]|uniref:Uncharacterized protein n=1 Tax=Acidihalobacter yilgarnensis TaxID=2819280 RepID=A0A1D8IQC7_9GAMM|nr:hypothetical protein [Acidihalobacter yilgarnensis]AOU98672.1 hypothetical protein BI364_12500 [Acidihalobacter yilgarnensis]